MTQHGGHGDADWAPPTPPTSSFALAGYTDVVEIARGGDSVVYRARQTGLDRQVAIKAVELPDEASEARFRRELELTVGLGRQHPHVVTVLDTGRSVDGRACLVMEYYDLGSIADRLAAHGPLSAGEVVTVGTVIADALDFAHRHGVLHRDIKPQNILLLPTSYVLADFGIARAADAGHTASVERFSYRHASPQVLDGLAPTAADDVWSLGSTLFTLLDGRPPFAAADPDDDTALAYLRRVRVGQARPLTRTDVPAALREVIDRCLRHEPAARFPDAAALRAALRRVPTEDRSWDPATATPPGSAPVSAATHEAPEARGSAAAPEVAEPPPLASSALAHLADPDRSARDRPGAAAPRHPSLSAAPEGWTADAAPTGMHPEAVPAAGPGAPEEPARSRGGLRRSVLFLAGALIVGSIGSAVISLLTIDPEDTVPSAPPPPSSVPIPEATDPAPSPVGPAQVEQSDPTVAPRNVTTTDNGTSVTVSWVDQTDGRAALFTVVQSSGPGADERDPVAETGGRSSVTIEGIDPDAGPLCFQVVAVVLGEGPDGRRAGASPEACLRS